MVILPGAFLDAADFQAVMACDLTKEPGSRAVSGGEVMAPGDREWAEADRRAAQGIPIDPATASAFAGLAREFGLGWPAPDAIRSTAT